MSDTFNLNRFGRLFYKHYMENKTAYLFLILCVFIFNIIIFPNGFGHVEIADTGDAIEKMSSRLFFSLRMLIGCVVILLTVGYNDIIKQKSIHLNAAILPCSTFEKFLFMILNPLIVGAIYFYFIYAISATLLEAHIFINSEGNLILTPIINISGYELDQAEYFRANIIGNIFEIRPPSDKFTPLWTNVFTYSIALLIVSIVTWCKVSFKRAITGTLLHLALFLMGAFTYDYIKLHSLKAQYIPIEIISLLPLLLALVYLYSSYNKMKGLQAYN